MISHKSQVEVQSRYNVCALLSILYNSVYPVCIPLMVSFNIHVNRIPQPLEPFSGYTCYTANAIVEVATWQLLRSANDCTSV